MNYVGKGMLILGYAVSGNWKVSSPAACAPQRPATCKGSTSSPNRALRTLVFSDSSMTNGSTHTARSSDGSPSQMLTIRVGAWSADSLALVGQLIEKSATHATTSRAAR
jgi:hypothetical protein